MRILLASDPYLNLLFDLFTFFFSKKKGEEYTGRIVPLIFPNRQKTRQPEDLQTGWKDALKVTR